MRREILSGEGREEGRAPGQGRREVGREGVRGIKQTNFGTHVTVSHDPALAPTLDTSLASSPSYPACPYSPLLLLIACHLMCVIHLL